MTSPNSPDSNQAQPPSPIADVNPQTLDYVFSKNPKELTDAEVDTIVGQLREKRTLWHQQELTGAKKATGAAKAALVAAKPTLSVDDLLG